MWIAVGSAADSVGVGVGVAAAPLGSGVGVADVPTEAAPGETSVTMTPSWVMPLGLRTGLEIEDPTASATAVPMEPTATAATNPMMTRRMIRARDCWACTSCAFSRTASRVLRAAGTFGVSSLDIVPLEDRVGRVIPRLQWRAARDCHGEPHGFDVNETVWEIPR